MAMNVLAVLTAVVFLGLSALHVYWAVGGRRGTDAVIPTVEGRRTLNPTAPVTIGVAVALGDWCEREALIMNMSVKWAAELAHVREVSLLGTADLVFWKERLLKEELLPAESDGQAQLLIIAADAKYLGVRFRELSVSVAVSRLQQGAWQDAAYLVRAFNSCRTFAFCERVFFSTPYYHGDVRVSASLPASMRLVKQGEVVFAAEMAADAPGLGREPSRCGEDCWEGPVFLPESRRRTGRQGKLFVARLRGHTQRYPFLPGLDSVAIRPSPDSEVLQALQGSHFVAKEWIVRADATHAKSKTYKKDVLPPRGPQAEPAAAPDRGSMAASLSLTSHRGQSRSGTEGDGA